MSYGQRMWRTIISSIKVTAYRIHPVNLRGNIKNMNLIVASK